MNRRYISVVTRSPESVQAYLYDHTTILGQVTSEDGQHTGMVLRTEAEDNVDYLVSYQADRLSSGLHGANTHDTMREAVDRIWDMTGVDPIDDMVEQVARLRKMEKEAQEVPTFDWVHLDGSPCFETGPVLDMADALNVCTHDRRVIRGR